MRLGMIVVLLVGAPMLQACQPQAKQAYTSEDANEDAALNAIREQDNETQGAGLAASGMIPDSNGHLPMANVQ